MKRKKAINYSKRLLCITMLLFWSLANISLVFADAVYNYSEHTRDDFDNMIDNDPIKKLQLTGGDYSIIGNDINQDSTITLDTFEGKNFSIINTNEKINPMIMGIGKNETGVYNSITFFNRDGTHYNLQVLKEEIIFENVKLTSDESMTGNFNFNGEYLIKYSDGLEDEKLNVSISGVLGYYSYGSSSYTNDENRVLIFFNCIANDNEGTFEINGDTQLKKVLTYDDDIADNIYDQITLDVSLQIASAEFGVIDELIIENEEVQEEEVIVENEVNETPIDNKINEIPTNNEVKEIPVENEIVKEDININNDSFKVETPQKVAAAVVVSIALATTGSAALTSASGSAMNNFVQLEEQNDKIQKQSGNVEEENNKRIENNTEYSFIINNGESMPELCNTKEAVINIPIYIENGEDLIWNFNFIPICPNGLNVVAGSVINPDGNNSTNLSISITGKQFVENSLQIFCNIVAHTGIDDNKIQIHDAFELTIYNIGLHANIIDPSKKILKDNLNVNYVRESKIKGIAEVIKLKICEFDIEIVEENEEQFKLIISAAENKDGICYLIVKK